MLGPAPRRATRVWCHRPGKSMDTRTPGHRVTPPPLAGASSGPRLPTQVLHDRTIDAGILIACTYTLIGGLALVRRHTCLLPGEDGVSREAATPPATAPTTASTTMPTTTHTTARRNRWPVGTGISWGWPSHHHGRGQRGPVEGPDSGMHRVGMAWPRWWGWVGSLCMPQWQGRGRRPAHISRGRSLSGHWAVTRSFAQCRPRRGGEQGACGEEGRPPATRRDPRARPTDLLHPRQAARSLGLDLIVVGQNLAHDGGLLLLLARLGGRCQPVPAWRHRGCVFGASCWRCLGVDEVAPRARREGGSREGGARAAHPRRTADSPTTRRASCLAARPRLLPRRAPNTRVVPSQRLPAHEHSMSHQSSRATSGRVLMQVRPNAAWACAALRATVRRNGHPRLPISTVLQPHSAHLGGTAPPRPRLPPVAPP